MRSSTRFFGDPPAAALDEWAGPLWMGDASGCDLQPRWFDGASVGSSLRDALAERAGAGDEVVVIAAMLDRGFAVVATDYQGIGTCGLPTAGIRVPTSRAVIDSARAAIKLPQHDDHFDFVDGEPNCQNLPPFELP